MTSDLAEQAGKGRLRNRVDPWGDLHAVADRGLFTGNRGCLVDDRGETVRHHSGTLWITCLTEYRGWRSPLAQPGHWTPLFFLDEAVALAAGHRPCGLCRRGAYEAYLDAVASADGSGRRLGANDLNRRLAMERLTRGRGLDRARHRRVWRTGIDNLPDGAVIVGQPRHPQLVLADRVYPFTFAGWDRPLRRPSGTDVDVLTPPTSVAALAHGFDPVLHPTATSGR